MAEANAFPLQHLRLSYTTAMADSSDAPNPSHEIVKEAIQLTRQERFSEAIETFETLLPQLSSGDLADKRVAVSAFSFYGLCVAMVKRRYAKGVEYCNVSLRSNSFDPDHRYNLARVYLERGERKKAVEALNAGLRLQPDNRRIQSIFDQIGRRQPPVLPFLARSNLFNIWLGKLLRSSKKKR